MREYELRGSTKAEFVAQWPQVPAKHRTLLRSALEGLADAITARAHVLITVSGRVLEAGDDPSQMAEVITLTLVSEA